ncbi:hypothetical protein ACLOJK_029578, partial [Asimina triloba]
MPFTPPHPSRGAHHVDPTPEPLQTICTTLCAAFPYFLEVWKSNAEAAVHATAMFCNEPCSQKW